MLRRRLPAPRSVAALVSAMLLATSVWATLASGCETRLLSLTIDVQTDLVPSLEVGLLEVEVLEGDVPRGTTSVRARRTAVMPQLPEAGEYQRGRRIAELGGMSPGVYTVRAIGRRPAPPGAPEDGGTILAERRVVILLDRDRVVRVVLGASCVGVTCPGVGDPDEATQCLNGRCVDAACDPSLPTAGRDCCAGIGCVELALCQDASDCDTAPCAQPRCVDGACIAEDLPGSCAPDEYCDRSARACLPLPASLRPDAGAPDAGALDAAVLLDAYVEPGEDAGAFDAWLCPAEICGNGADDDCDGTSDCMDADCVGASCDDGEPCTHHDVCTAGGSCAGTAITCTSSECVTRACNGSATCTETPRSGACTDDGNACTSDVCSAGRCAHSARADGSSCGTGRRCCAGACTNPATDANHCGVCGVDCGSHACVAGACRCAANAECRSYGYGSAATCYDPGDGNGMRCQCVCNADSAWRGTCGECPGAAQCDQVSGLNVCYYP
ncbi:MAG: hypothetical protein K1X94_26245 [Sandaracinaceae bacterium]|nr:hypothetical protein [Sandaracinaceae bacterium]